MTNPTGSHAAGAFMLQILSNADTPNAFWTFDRDRDTPHPTLQAAQAERDDAIEYGYRPSHVRVVAIVPLEQAQPDAGSVARLAEVEAAALELAAAKITRDAPAATGGMSTAIARASRLEAAGQLLAMAREIRKEAQL